MTDLSKEITALESSQERNKDYDLWGAKYLALHDRIAYLAVKKVIPNDVARYFDANFAAALALVKEQRFQKYESGLGSLIHWCNSNNIQSSVAPKPYSES
ncbi:hypothetical protein [Nitrososphaera sp.]|uniref:hypothetical protein n=1 Tax=Nitrososphaera sp. TaxID=1971748 RepID=UPI00307FB3A5